MAGAQASSQAARAVHAALMAPHTALPLSLSHAHTSTPSPPPSYTLTQCHVSQPAHLMGGHGSPAPGSLGVFTASGGRPFGKTGSASCRLRVLPGAASVQTKF